MRCGDCRYYEPSNTSILGGWCLVGAHLHERKNTCYGVDEDDSCRDWEAKDEQAKI